MDTETYISLYVLQLEFSQNYLTDTDICIQANLYMSDVNIKESWYVNLFKFVGLQFCNKTAEYRPAISIKAESS